MKIFQRFFAIQIIGPELTICDATQKSKERRRNVKKRIDAIGDARKRERNTGRGREKKGRRYTVCTCSSTLIYFCAL